MSPANWMPLPSGLAIRMSLLDERQAQRNHGGHSLQTLASRGGLSFCEALAIAEQRPWRAMPAHEALAALAALKP